MVSKALVDSSDDKWIYGHTIRYDKNNHIEANIAWVQITDSYHKKIFPTLRDPVELFADYSMDVSVENAKYLQKIWDENWFDGICYFRFSCLDLEEYANEISKIIINDFSSLANELDLPVFRFISPIEVNCLSRALFLDKLFDKKHLKAITLRYIGYEPLSDILIDPNFQSINVDDIIMTTLNELGPKLDGSDKMLNWFVGQIMKKTQGKANASYVKEKVNKLLSK